MEDYIKVKDYPGLVRDKKSKAILSVDKAGLERYRIERENNLKIKKVVDEFDTLQNDVAEIKNLLQQLLKKK